MADRLYCGSGKQIDGKYGPFYSIMVNLSQLKDYTKEHGFDLKNGDRCMRLDLSERRSPDKAGNTHSLVVNTYKPPAKEETPEEPVMSDDDPNMPF